ncbi:MAG: hypothetical protein M1823_006695, partial [Watsoniomyces obsoletus]
VHQRRRWWHPLELLTLQPADANMALSSSDPVLLSIWKLFANASETLSKVSGLAARTESRTPKVLTLSWAQPSSSAQRKLRLLSRTLLKLRPSRQTNSLSTQ